MKRLQDKVAIVTGGAGGLGSVVCARLVEEGARVVIADIDGARARALQQQLGDATMAYEFTYVEEASVRGLIDATIDRWGRLDILHNNATIVPKGDGLLEHADPDAWDLSYQVNVRGYMLASKHAIPHMRRQKRGIIINMGSDSALAGDLMLTAYGVVKAGVLTMSQYIATQCGKDGIRCVSITPGAMLTDSMRNHMGEEGVRRMESHHLTPSLGSPSDLAALVSFLGGDEANFITGINIPVDGGFFSHLPTYADASKASRAAAAS